MEVLWSSTMAFVEKMYSLSSLGSIRRLLDCFVVMVLFFVSLTLIYRPATLFRRYKKIYPNEEYVEQIVLSKDFNDDGFSFVPAHNKEKYLSYEPPVGSWSEQLQAFEKAALISKLLHRTVLAQPLFSELECKRLRDVVRNNMQPDSKVYELLDKKHTVPISSVVDLNHLSKLVKVRDIRSSHNEFLTDFNNITRYDVCHRASAGFWVDFIPESSNVQAWEILSAQHFVPLSHALPGVEPACDHELEMVDNPYKPVPFVRGIISELQRVNEDLVYFRGGSIARSDIRFLSKRRTELAQEWAVDYIRFTPYVQEKTRRIMAKLRKPYNAVLFSGQDELENLNNTIHYRMRQMEKLQFQRVTNVLYVITQVTNLTAFEPLERAGYEVHFARKLIPPGIGPLFRYDVTELLGFMICKYARLYAGPRDSYLLQRGRIHEAETRDNLFVDNISVRWAVHTVAPTYRFHAQHNGTQNAPQALIKAHHISCTVCKFMQRTLKHALCSPLMSECSKLRII